MKLSVGAVIVRGRWFKHAYPGSLPLPEREPPPDNRWQCGDVVDALYLADSDDTAWAEWYRHLAERMIPPLAQMPRELWTWKVNVEVADLSTAEHLADVGLQPPVPGRRSWSAFQRVGEQLSKDGWTGLIAPSAARPAGRVLCLFRMHLASLVLNLCRLHARSPSRHRHLLAFVRRRHRIEGKQERRPVHALAARLNAPRRNRAISARTSEPRPARTRSAGYAGGLDHRSCCDSTCRRTPCAR